MVQEILGEWTYEQYPNIPEHPILPLNKLVIAGLVHLQNEIKEEVIQHIATIFSQNTYPTSTFWNDKVFDQVDGIGEVFKMSTSAGQTVGFLKKNHDRRAHWILFIGPSIEQAAMALYLCIGSDERDLYEAKNILRVIKRLHENNRVTYLIHSRDSIYNGVPKEEAQRNRDLRITDDKFIYKDGRYKEMINTNLSANSSKGGDRNEVVISLDEDCPQNPNRNNAFDTNLWMADLVITEERQMNGSLDVLIYDGIPGGASFKESLPDFAIPMRNLIDELPR